MKKFLFNCNNPNTPAGDVCIKGLSHLLQEAGHSVTFNDWENYSAYDYVIFMAYESKVAEAKVKNPAIHVGLGDPKTENSREAALADFLLVSSVEQRDLFLALNPNCYIYYMFPEIPRAPIAPRAKERLVIAYHGNKVHLDALYPRVITALQLLSRQHPIELRVIYNIKGLGPWKIGRPSNLGFPVKCVQWSPENLVKELSDADIGIVPNDIPLKNEKKIKRSAYGFAKIFLESEEDYLLRFKYSSNPGRIYVFERMGIPVVADFFPSAAQFLEHGRRGLLAHSTAGWLRALEDLAASVELRKNYAEALRSYIENNYSRERVFQDFLLFLENLKPVPISNNFWDLSNHHGLRYRLEIWNYVCRRALLSLMKRLKLVGSEERTNAVS